MEREVLRMFLRTADSPQGEFGMVVGGFSTAILNMCVLVGMQSLGMSITKAEREQREAAGRSRPVFTSKAAERHRLRQDVYIYIWTFCGG